MKNFIIGMSAGVFVANTAFKYFVDGNNFLESVGFGTLCALATVAVASLYSIMTSK